MGHHIDSEGRFQSDKYPELGPDKIVVSFQHPHARAALRVLARDYQPHDAELADDITMRLDAIAAEETAAKRRDAEAAAAPVDRDARVLTDGRTEAQAPDYREINPATGQQKSYVVLTPEERAKGFVRPVRRSYVHVGWPAPKYPLRELTAEERAGYGDEGFAAFEVYPASAAPSVGRFWTQAEIDGANKGCGATTTMSSDIAETYARSPGFYGGTFCVQCRTHLPVGERGEFVWEGTTERVGT